ncbi:tetratricopeptide repeat protein [Candidatus Thioglobus sp.]|nr:tetratricopeptide repeat protein [Candidatus Thioglobus sp.]
MSIKTQRLLDRAKKLTKKGKVGDAQKIYSTVLKSFPKNQEAKKELLKLGQITETKPTQVQLNEVMRFYSSGKLQEALSANQLLIKNFPNDPLLLNISGACYSEIGPIESAIKSFKKAITLNPNYAEAHYNLGVAFQRTRQIDEAIECYEEAINIKHTYPSAHNNLGLVALERGNIDSAIKSFEWAVAYNPEYAEAHNNLGAAFQELNQFDAAIKHYKKAVAINPEYAQAFNNLGISSESIGLKVEALTYYEKAIAIKFDFTEAHFNLSGVKKYIESDIQISTMKSLLSSSNLDQSGQIFINFALAKVNDDLGNKDVLFKFLNEGNRLRKDQLNYSINEHHTKHSLIKKISSPSLPSINNDSLDDEKFKRPIFIVGMPRSGTTLVEQIISNHHAVYGADELSTISELTASVLEDSSFQAKNGLNEEYFLSMRKQYLHSLSSFNINEDIITDKWPLNFQYIGFILTAFPEAKIIHLKRDARAVCWSIYKHYFSGKGNGWAYNFDDLASFYASYSDLMNFWHELFPDKIYDINYEKLTTNQKDETKNLLEYCDLDWDDNCLNFYTNTRAVKTASASQVRKKMYQGSSENWKNYEEHIQSLLKGLSPFSN